MQYFKSSTFERKVRDGEFEVQFGPTRCGFYQVKSNFTGKVRTVQVTS